jgi:hypothetical protein
MVTAYRKVLDTPVGTYAGTCGVPLLPLIATLQLSVAAKLGGYLTNIVMEHMGCSLCAAVYTSSVWRLVFGAPPHNRLLQAVRMLLTPTL